jgi:hypothetical protein
MSYSLFENLNELFTLLVNAYKANSPKKDDPNNNTQSQEEGHKKE